MSVHIGKTEEAASCPAWAVVLSLAVNATQSVKHTKLRRCLSMVVVRVPCAHVPRFVILHPCTYPFGHDPHTHGILFRPSGRGCVRYVRPGFVRVGYLDDRRSFGKIQIAL